MKKLLILSLISLNLFSCKTSKNVNNEDTSVKTKSAYWQQHVDYQMDIDMDVNNYQYKGKQKLVYTNNSPDELYKVYYHLYFNAFQPGSEMDALLQSVPDPDGRMTTNTGTKENPIIVSRIKKPSSK
jgi:uncharacterized protein YcfL